MNPDVHSVNLAKITLLKLGFPSVREAEQDPLFIKFQSPARNVLAKPYNKMLSPVNSGRVSAGKPTYLSGAIQSPQD